ncbi:TCR/Tet family MFS transporter [Sphingomonas sp. 28-63-12]|uniref:TCR/Tet family MFS transporter n=1 Tax=Sphingomonas sp. 28-63-12 TaxID=1970434 RepID=UPI000BDD5DB9|nr:MAG: hypothetical protein B7Y47_16240 [Sphingomonas sp. 28-63-12]
MTQEGAKAQRSTRSVLALVAMIVFLDIAGIGLIMPVMPRLIMSMTGVAIDRAAELGGWLLFAYAVMQFFFAPVIGGLSDRYGRRPVLLLTLFALGIDYALMAWAPTLGWLFVGRVISGVMGATFAAANSCIADIVPPEDRGRAFGALGGAGAAGFVLGPGIGGLLGGFGERVPFMAASGLALVGALVGWFVLQETLPVARRRAFSILRANPVGSIAQMVRVPLVMGCLTAILFMQLAAQSQLSVWSYQGIARFGWSPLVIGLTIALFGVMLIGAQGFAVGPLVKRFGARSVAMAGAACGIPSYVILATAPNTGMMIVGMVIGACTGVAFPAMQDLMTRRVPENAQGELQGAIASVASLTAIVGPPLMTGVFGAYSDAKGVYFPGAPFLLSAILLGIGLAVLVGSMMRHGGEMPARV